VRFDIILDHKAGFANAIVGHVSIAGERQVPEAGNCSGKVPGGGVEPLNGRWPGHVAYFGLGPGARRCPAVATVTHAQGHRNQDP